jgi:hypothetical protein
MSRIEKLTAEILRDRERLAASNIGAVECHACGRKFSGRDDGHCSDRCLAWTERGEAPYSQHSRFDPFSAARWMVIAGGDPGYLVAMPMRKGPDGFYIRCRACGEKFESKGMAYCATCLTLPAEERHAMQPGGRACLAPDCGNVLAATARVDARYCSKACARRAGRAKGDKNGGELLA